MTAKLTSGMLAAITMSAVAFSGAAEAKSKMSYEQAFGKCKAEISKNVPMSDTTTSAARYTAGSACMKKYGYRLKKGAPM
jgi:hypothetical protein